MIEEQLETTKAQEIENKKQEFKRAAQLGKDVLGTARARQDARLTPYMRAENFSSGHEATLRDKKPEEITPEDVSNALDTSFQLATEAAAQICDARLPVGGMVREDAKSLGDILRVLNGGNSLRKSKGDEGEQKKYIAEETRKVLARRKGVQPSELEVSDEQLVQQFEFWYKTAATRISRALDSAANYRR